MKRLDTIIATRLGVSRSIASKIIKSGYVNILGNKETSLSKNITINNEELINISDGWENLLNNNLDYIVPQNIPLDVIYEDDNVLVINKPPGISVHTSSSEKENTILNGFLFKLKNTEKIGILERPGIVHRLDKDTSGVLILAKNVKTQSFLSDQFKSRFVDKYYYAVVEGIIEKPLTIEKSIFRNKFNRKKMAIDVNGRYALTSVTPINSYFKDRFNKFTYLLVNPKTGRTHQIRVHLKSIGHPIVGDKIYNGILNKYMLLHAAKLIIDIPIYGRKEFEASIPSYFDEFLSSLNKL